MIWLRADIDQSQSAEGCQSPLTVTHIALGDGITCRSFNKCWPYWFLNQRKWKRTMIRVGLIASNQPMTKFRAATRGMINSDNSTKLSTLIPIFCKILTETSWFSYIRQHFANVLAKRDAAARCMVNLRKKLFQWLKLMNTPFIFD